MKRLMKRLMGWAVPDTLFVPTLTERVMAEWESAYLRGYHIGVLMAHLEGDYGVSWQEGVGVAYLAPSSTRNERVAIAIVEGRYLH